MTDDAGMERTHSHSPDSAHRLERTIETTGSGTAAAAPELVILRLAVQTDHDHVAGALRRAGELMGSLHQVLRQAGVPGEHLRTEALTVHHRFDPQQDSPRGYQSTQTLTVMVRTDDEVQTVVSAAVEVAGDALALHGLEQALADPEALRPTARVRAVEDARSKAVHLAELVGRSLGEVRWVREASDGRAGPEPLAFGMSFEHARAVAPIERGQLTVSASVTVCWDLR